MSQLTTPNGTEYINRPLSYEQVRQMMEEDDIIIVNVAIQLDDLIEYNQEGLNAYICEKVIGHEYLQDIHINVVDVIPPNVVILEISGWVAEEEMNYLRDDESL